MCAVCCAEDEFARILTHSRQQLQFYMNNNYFFCYLTVSVFGIVYVFLGLLSAVLPVRGGCACACVCVCDYFQKL